MIHQILTLLAALALASADDSTPPMVTVENGMLRGRTLTTAKDRTIYSFEGIPYAKPPVGDRRFKVGFFSYTFLQEFNMMSTNTLL